MKRFPLTTLLNKKIQQFATIQKNRHNNSLAIRFGEDKTRIEREKKELNTSCCLYIFTHHHHRNHCHSDSYQYNAFFLSLWRDKRNYVLEGIKRLYFYFSQYDDKIIIIQNQVNL